MTAIPDSPTTGIAARSQRFARGVIQTARLGRRNALEVPEPVRRDRGPVLPNQKIAQFDRPDIPAPVQTNQPGRLPPRTANCNLRVHARPPSIPSRPTMAMNAELKPTLLSRPVMRRHWEMVRLELED
ncbi:uncharacterized protein ASPGLDRAFT_35741 [Aspergillus glaucus CBS 516.65]|uniref:Uncharacterized protein n=1 Tax=Aspergillus glaucus CBS 516.65 TaxID=1160497 RepID=A0A1L9VIF7_ASPGL|nr:hypothetical protein ASPGLDRAFT_35741 [Aspergillus glaucus CBS 516.65]OJJ83709.1 hypothetical protein ASPGLDRAFT_35741 [Aspergillus glaucus CBS 516.65]